MEKEYRNKVRSEFDCNNLPDVVEFVLNEADAKEIASLSALVKANDLFKAEKHKAIAHFYRYGDDDEISTSVDCLCVSGTEFWFSAFANGVEVMSERNNIATMKACFGLVDDLESAGPGQNEKHMGEGKQVTDKELAEIVTRLLTDTKATGELDDFDTFQQFMADIAQVVCDYCGGATFQPANFAEGFWSVSIRKNECLPDPFGGIWRECDKSGDLFAVLSQNSDPSTCSDCGNEVESIVGCPDGAEVCQQCFDAGGH